MYILFLFLVFEKFNVYMKLFFKNYLNGLSEPINIRSDSEPKFINIQMGLKFLITKKKPKTD